MEGELWKRVYELLVISGKKYSQAKVQYSTRRIVAVYLWAVLHDRPTCWACDERNWPEPSLGDLPSPSCMSRRLRTAPVQALLVDLEEHYRQHFGQSLWRCIDAMPLVIGSASHDRQAGFGRAATGKAKGYKFYAICTPGGVAVAWRVGPMHCNEQRMAQRLLRDVNGEGYLLGDGEYDNNKLFDHAGAKGIQLVVPKRKGARLGHRRQSPYRLRSIDLCSRPFGYGLLKQRASIDRFFGAWNSSGCGIKHLPPWVRTHFRVRLWVQAKLIFHYVRSERQTLIA